MISIEFTNGDILSGNFQGIGKGSGRSDIYEISNINTFFREYDKFTHIRLKPTDIYQVSEGKVYGSISLDNTWWYDVTKIVRVIDSETEHRNIKIDMINEG